MSVLTKKKIVNKILTKGVSASVLKDFIDACPTVRLNSDTDGVPYSPYGKPVNLHMIDLCDTIASKLPQEVFIKTDNTFYSKKRRKVVKSNRLNEELVPLKEALVSLYQRDKLLLLLDKVS